MTWHVENPATDANVTGKILGYSPTKTGSWISCKHQPVLYTVVAHLVFTRTGLPTLSLIWQFHCLLVKKTRVGMFFNIGFTTVEMPMASPYRFIPSVVPLVNAFLHVCSWSGLMFPCWYLGPVRERSGQWPFQEPKLEVPTIFQGLCKGISQQNMAL